MQICQLLPIFLCFINLVFYLLFCNSSLLLYVQQVCFASTFSVILLCFFSFCHSALLLLFLSFFSTSTLHFISLCTFSKSHATHPLIFPFLLFRSFSIRNNQPFTFCLILFYTHFPDGSTSHFLRQNKDNCPSN